MAVTMHLTSAMNEPKPDHLAIIEELLKAEAHPGGETPATVIEKTSNPIAHWTKLLDALGALQKKSNDVVAYLQTEHHVPRYWLPTGYLKSNL